MSQGFQGPDPQGQQRYEQFPPGQPQSVYPPIPAEFSAGQPSYPPAQPGYQQFPPGVPLAQSGYQQYPQDFPPAQSGYQQFPPGYQPTPPGYSQSPPGYPGYGPVGYPMAPAFAGAASKAPRPGSALAAAVLAFVQAGFLLISGVITATVGSDASGGPFDFGGPDLIVVGWLTVIAGGLLIAGATSILNRRRTILIVGTLLSIGISLYYFFRFFSQTAHNGEITLPLVFAVLPVIALALTMSADVRAWVKTSVVPGR